MLTTPEKLLFLLVAFFSIFATVIVTRRIIRIISRGQGKPSYRIAWYRIVSVLAKTVTLQPTFRIRILPSLFHAFIAWGFLIFLLVNIGDLLEAFFRNFTFLGQGTIGNLYRLSGDIFSVLALTGMTALLFRRFVFKSNDLTVRKDILLDPKARRGIKRDSAIVGGFILIHVGARLLGATFSIALNGYDIWQPIASSLASSISGLSDRVLTVCEHQFFNLGLLHIFALHGFAPDFLLPVCTQPLRTRPFAHSVPA